MTYSINSSLYKILTWRPNCNYATHDCLPCCCFTAYSARRIRHLKPYKRFTVVKVVSVTYPYGCPDLGDLIIIKFSCRRYALMSLDRIVPNL